MTDPAFTILMPVVRSPELMPFAINSVLSQSRGDFELFIIGDGAPAETMAVADSASKQDSRIRVFPFPKGQRHGEAHRHTALEQARGRYVCQLADDDLWFPEHLEEVAALLAEFEFGNLLHIRVSSEDIPSVALNDLADRRTRARMAARVFNFFGPSHVGYRMETYRRLPVGWSPAPQGIPTDLVMWRKFLALPDIAAGTRFVATSLHFPTDQRRDWLLERRRAETARYSGIIATPKGREELRQQALRGQGAWHEAELAALRSSWSWRLTAPLRRVVGFMRGEV